jgi:hypothetical protein
MVCVFVAFFLYVVGFSILHNSSQLIRTIRGTVKRGSMAEHLPCKREALT